MGRWAYLLGGLIVWAVHFVGVYAIASLADLVERAEAAPWRMGMLAFSGLCLLAEIGLFAWALRRLRQGEEAFQDRLALLGAGLGGVAIAWQTLPTLVGY
jgi:hypothetical protein